MGDELRKAEQRELTALRERDAALTRVKALEAGLAEVLAISDQMSAPDLHQLAVLIDIRFTARAALAEIQRPAGAG